MRVCVSETEEAKITNSKFWVPPFFKGFTKSTGGLQLAGGRAISMLGVILRSEPVRLDGTVFFPPQPVLVGAYHKITASISPGHLT